MFFKHTVNSEESTIWVFPHKLTLNLNLYFNFKVVRHLSMKMWIKEFNNQNNFTMFDQKITFKKFLKGKKLDKPKWDLNF